MFPKHKKYQNKYHFSIPSIYSQIILIFFMASEFYFSMNDFSDLSLTSKAPSFNVYRIILKTPCLSNQFYDLNPFFKCFSTSENATLLTSTMRDKEATIAVLTAAILSPKKLNKTGINIIVFSLYFTLLFMFSKKVSFGLHDLCFRMLSTTFLWNSLIGGSWGNIFILKFVSDASSNLSSPSQSCSRHKLYANVVFNWRDAGGWSTFSLTYSERVKLSSIYKMTFFISWGSFS